MFTEQWHAQCHTLYNTICITAVHVNSSAKVTSQTRLLVIPGEGQVYPAKLPLLPGASAARSCVKNLVWAAQSHVFMLLCLRSSVINRYSSDSSQQGTFKEKKILKKHRKPLKLFIFFFFRETKSSC